MTNSIDIAQNASQYAGLKMYLNQTFSTLQLLNLSSWILVSTTLYSLLFALCKCQFIINY